MIYHQLNVICSSQEEIHISDMIALLEPLSISFLPYSEDQIQIQALFLEQKPARHIPHSSWTILSEASWNHSDFSIINGLTIECPKTVFGHGQHPTTQLCQSALTAWQMTHQNVSNLHVIDVGTGSGILSLICAQNGISSLEAIDYDPFAIKIAVKNAQMNHLPETFFSVADLFTWRPQKKADLLIANLPIAVLEQGFERLDQWLLPTGNMIISGLTEQWASAIEMRFESFSSLSLLKKTILNGWVCYLLG